MRHRRPHVAGRTAGDGLAAHLRASLWGPAEFVGLPPRRLLAKGLLVGALGTSAVTGGVLLGMWAGPAALASGEAGLGATGAVAVYLTALRAGRILVALVVVIGVCLALFAPTVAGDVVLARRGKVQPVVVTSVDRDSRARPGGSRTWLCTVAVAPATGIPLKTRIRRGCGQTTEPGDALAVRYDPRGLAPTRGMPQPGEERKSLLQLAGLSAALIAGCALAVVRSFRLTA
ncbi:hypothetical protein [Streptomyces sp. NPDC048527]|uniref:hypothetical protein n=1 Tax=Streptomyces sp. NPDC048527 TaxID=3365568 RepID=UPI0037175BDE